MNRFIRGAAAGTVAVIAAIVGSVAMAQEESCAFFPTGQESYSCTCTPDAVAGAVWGSGPYTADSNFCSAALHAGVIGPDGGNVIAFEAGPQESFAGSVSNGVETRDWQAYQSSFVFEAPVSPAEAALDDLETCSTFPEEYDILRCFCDARAAASGSVWGSWPYTADSSICMAAVHAGIIKSKGGVVVVVREDGQASYAGTESNGILSRDWGSYPTSFVFEFVP